jgi:hypothetical protein
MSDLGVLKSIWYSTSLEITVATVSTIVYQYDNTAVTSYQTITPNSTATFPTGTFENSGGYYAIPGIPTDIIKGNLGLYPAGSSLVYGTELTDPYGVVYPSPTPIWDFHVIDDKYVFLQCGSLKI